MKYYLVLILNFCFITVSSQQNAAIEKFVQTSGFENASIGVCVKDLSGNNIVSYNKAVSLTPASTLKILTTATALELLGEDYQFSTELSIDKNNPQHLIVHGHGDPTLGSEYLFENPSAFLGNWVQHIQKKFKTEYPIDITIADDFFGYNGISSKWLREDMGNYFASGAYGISVFDNMYQLFLNTMRTDTCPAILKTVPNMRNIVFSNNLQLNYEGKDNGNINGEPFSNYRRLAGDIPAKRSSFVIKGDFPDPGIILGEALANTLAQNNFRINSIGTTRQQYFQQMYNSYKANPYETVSFYKELSPALREIIRVINEKSNNHYSEHLMRTIGRQANPDTYSDPLTEGINRTNNYWASKGLNTDGIHIYDGCGLAPSNSINPEILCDILIYMQVRSKYTNAFFTSLPKAGKEGTVRNLLKGTRLQGKLYVKSGSIANVQCYAGYYIDGDKKYVFSIMVNNYNSPRKDVVRAIESLLLDLF
ncbi:D-alanyl-D-alanine carboxypeptidase/D-alanyl-D-alanine-endopeptidase (penicillin-binding protein 4) [Dysgonomonas alginatilytica]|uniref:D-alanyl-D-alanine carboxypeptidase/D-alanyl-D-alanine-endopeptidase (Penicillin-binding protein 4) n=1 Tax=Dysgonomonas alginatilytica TaxID=1605892 RepID=A0A2V3PRV2_9BACT|nr:D-alanyl-D-alanine carboxypeptidase/D-alanyl-D-alanine-endopeptidase [Dysgonomonas alginatilytica]PXV61016.1 D-alanyl-D-alanine carboxypeptidase/D-alanyl-D-alanine-endopeptidase (penicillin-binding protein 4) [Dysgonomonas alginatilytica]